jgi:hypothetical protein
MGDAAMAMGDLVLTESEINPVMAKLLGEGIEVTAVHNHLLRASPATFYMHIEGHGDAAKLAESIRAGLALSKTPMQASPAASSPPPVDLDTAKLDEAIGVKGRANGGVYGFNVPRADTVKDSGMVVPAALGSAIAINFEPTGGGTSPIATGRTAPSKASAWKRKQTTNGKSRKTRCVSGIRWTNSATPCG